jgi:2'-5' RNA ligase
MDFLSDDEKEFDIVVQALKMFEKNNYEFKNQYVFASGINRFDMNATWIGLNDSLKLYKIKYLINDYLKQLGFDKKKSKFKEYVPHITLGFNCENKPINIKVNKIAIPVDNITLWNSFKCNGKYISNYLYAVNL